MTQPELSIVIPFLNEEQVLPLLRERLEKLKNRPIIWELVFVSDGSTDGSVKLIEAWAQRDASVKLSVLTRNFGHQNAVSAGLSYASGTCVGITDADLQDEPEVLLEMYHLLLREKVDVVCGSPPARAAREIRNGFPDKPSQARKPRTKRSFSGRLSKSWTAQRLITQNPHTNPTLNLAGLEEVRPAMFDFWNRPGVAL